MRSLALRTGRRAVTACVAAALLTACGGSSTSHAVSSSATSAAQGPPDYSVTYPSTWSPQQQLPHSAFLSFLAVGRSSQQGCPNPLLLVRRQVAPGGSLAAAVTYYNRVEQLRRPQRRVIAQRVVAVAGAKQAVLIVARFPATRVSAKMVTSYDLIVLSTRGVALHVFASGCAADLPPRFLTRYILSFNAATNAPGAASLAP